MKNDFNFKNKFFKEKGFYVALYSVLAILIVVGMVAAIRNIMGGGRIKEEKKESVKSNQEEIASVNYGLDKNIPEDIPPISSYQDPFETIEDLISEIDETENTKKIDTNKEEEKNISSEEVVKLENPAVKVVEVKEKTIKEVAHVEEETFEGFVESDKMSWPIIGEIVMDYSNDHVVYDKTLDHYRTNESIWISGEVGDQIKATADGVVVDVLKDSKYGNAVVIDNGNGWMTTYAQLQDNILVNVGNVVRVGQVIGGMSKPTNNAIVQGTHLNLSVTKNDESIDPKLLLAQ